MYLPNLFISKVLSKEADLTLRDLDIGIFDTATADAAGQPGFEETKALATADEGFAIGRHFLVSVDVFEASPASNFFLLHVIKLSK